MSKKKKSQTDYTFPEDWDLYETHDEVHCCPEDDVFEHALEYQCPCKPRYMNKLAADLGEERHVYIHNYFASVVN